MGKISAVPESDSYGLFVGHTLTTPLRNVQFYHILSGTAIVRLRKQLIVEPFMWKNQSGTGVLTYWVLRSFVAHTIYNKD